MELHDRLKAAREDADLTQAQVAEQTGIARRQYIRYEQGAQEMGIAKLRALCLTLGVSADYLLGLPRGLSWPRSGGAPFQGPQGPVCMPPGPPGLWHLLAHLGAKKERRITASLFAYPKSPETFLFC